MEIFLSDTISNKYDTFSFLRSIIVGSAKGGYVHFIADGTEILENLLFYFTIEHTTKPLYILADDKFRLKMFYYLDKFEI